MKILKHICMHAILYTRPISVLERIFVNGDNSDSVRKYAGKMMCVMPEVRSFFLEEKGSNAPVPLHATKPPNMFCFGATRRAGKNSRDAAPTK